jgi:hypothetical protein
MTQMAERAATDRAPAAMIAGVIPLIISNFSLNWLQ